MNRTLLVICFLPFFLEGCVGYVFGPGGVSCKAVDASIGGDGTEVAAGAKAVSKNCTNSGHREPARSCCYKPNIFMTRTCTLRNGSWPEGSPCTCYIPTRYGMVAAGGVACDKDPDD